VGNHVGKQRGEPLAVGGVVDQRRVGEIGVDVGVAVDQRGGLVDPGVGGLDRPVALRDAIVVAEVAEVLPAA
jgi:hypothetical protein